MGKNYQKDLHKLIDKSNLPKDYGGDLEPIDAMIKR